MKITKIAKSDNTFPELLRNIPQPPKQIYVLGNLDNLINLPRLSVVGSRKVTPYGKGVTTKLAGEAAGHGIVIISGLAIGVDGLAHKAALEAGGRTIAVLPCGIDAPYPSRHRSMARQIIESGGALISEYPPGTPPLQHHFIERNRIVAGLGDGLLITEAATRSGTLHTAGFALEQGKTVMAVPGNVTSALSQGTNNLIKSGALPVTESKDIFEALKLNFNSEKNEVMAANNEEKEILDCIRDGLSDAEKIQMATGMAPELFNQTLTMLEINGKIRALGTGHWALN